MKHIVGLVVMNVAVLIGCATPYYEAGRVNPETRDKVSTKLYRS
jgi:hypothetical protein